MGEARRREEVSRTNYQIPTGSTELADCVARVLLVYAEVFDAILFIKEDGDDLHPAWSEGSVVAIRPTDPRPALEDAIVKEVRRHRDHFELPIPDTALLIGHFHDMRLRGREPAVSPREFLAAVKDFFRTETGDGWRGVAPSQARSYWLDAHPGIFAVRGSGREAAL